MSSGTTVATQVFTTNLAYSFAGLESAAGFDEVLIDVTNIVSGAMRVDNVRFESLVNQPPVCQITNRAHESAKLANTGQLGGLSIFEGTGSSQFLGSRFSTTQTVQVTAIGGHLLCTAFGNQLIFGAIVSLPGPNGVPATFPADATEVVATALLSPPTPSNEISVPLSTILPPGDYALVFGTNRFGATGQASMPNVNIGTTGSSQILWDGTTWIDIGQTNLRFTVETIELAVDSASATTTVSLDGSASSDPEGGPLTFAWSSDCAGASFDLPNAATPNLTLATGCPDPAACNLFLTVTDASGNATSCSAPVSVQDLIAPTLSNVPADAAVQCDAVPAPASVTATDNNDPSATLTFTETSAPGSCPNEFVLTRTWDAADACGNMAQATQTITVSDTTAPVITCPADAVIECPATDTSPTVTGSPVVVENCGTAAVSSVDTTTPGCGSTLTISRVWTAVDDCGNSASCTQNITLVDTTPPAVTCNPMSIAGDEYDDESTLLIQFSASDACGPATTSAVVDITCQQVPVTAGQIIDF